MPAPVTMRLLAAAFLAGGAIGAGGGLRRCGRPALHAASAVHASGRSRRAQGIVSPPAEGAVSGRQSVLGAKARARRGAVPRQTPVRRRQPGMRELSRARQRLRRRQGPGRGVPGRPLKRHTPTLWNLAWSSPVFWDGRARSLEEQVAGPIESPDEMAQPMAALVARLAADPATVRAFAEAFPEAPAGGRQKSRQGDRDLRADLRVARDALRPLDRRRRAGVDRNARSPASGCLPARRNA